jgi:hypothetical protein
MLLIVIPNHRISSYIYVTVMKLRFTDLPCEISGSHGCEYEGDTAFWDIAPCSLVGVDRRFSGASASETSVYFNKHPSNGSTAQFGPWPPPLRFLNHTELDTR